MSRLPPLVLYREIALASQAAVRPTVEIGPFSIWNATGGGRPSRPFDPEVNLGSILWRGLDWLPVGDRRDPTLTGVYPLVDYFGHQMRDPCARVVVFIQELDRLSVNLDLIVLLFHFGHPPSPSVTHGRGSGSRRSFGPNRICTVVPVVSFKPKADCTCTLTSTSQHLQRGKLTFKPTWEAPPPALAPTMPSSNLSGLEIVSLTAT